MTARERERQRSRLGPIPSGGLLYPQRSCRATPSAAAWSPPRVERGACAAHPWRSRAGGGRHGRGPRRPARGAWETSGGLAGTFPGLWARRRPWCRTVVRSDAPITQEMCEETAAGRSARLDAPPSRTRGSTGGSDGGFRVGSWRRSGFRRLGRPRIRRLARRGEWTRADASPRPTRTVRTEAPALSRRTSSARGVRSGRRGRAMHRRLQPLGVAMCKSGGTLRASPGVPRQPVPDVARQPRRSTNR